jgi:dihydroorotate dehydrogenase (fumarate)
MANLATTLCGLELRNPLVLASGPLSFDGEALGRAHRAGAGAVVTKTIRREAARNPVPHMARLRTGLLNSEKWSDLPAVAWTERELPRAKELGATVIASVALQGRDARDIIPLLVAAGADALEVCSYEAEDVVPMVRDAVAAAHHVPVLAKVSANWPDVAAVAAACCAAGAAGITAIDSVGPALRIDVRRRAPLLDGGFAWVSGEAIFPIALRVVAQVSLRTRVPVVGTGGVQGADACVEMLMAGATAVGLCSHPIQRGLDAFATLERDLSARLDELGYESVDDARGAALDGLRDSIDAPQGSATRPQFAWAEAACTRCDLCVRVCAYRARRSPEETPAAECRFCGLCASVCPTGALRMEAVARKRGA